MWLAEKGGQIYSHPYDLGAYENLTMVFFLSVLLSSVKNVCTLLKALGHLERVTFQSKLFYIHLYISCFSLVGMYLLWYYLLFFYSILHIHYIQTMFDCCRYLVQIPAVGHSPHRDILDLDSAFVQPMIMLLLHQCQNEAFSVHNLSLHWFENKTYQCDGLDGPIL